MKAIRNLSFAFLCVALWSLSPSDASASGCIALWSDCNFENNPEAACQNCESTDCNYMCNQYNYVHQLNG